MFSRKSKLFMLVLLFLITGCASQTPVAPVPTDVNTPLPSTPASAPTEAQVVPTQAQAIPTETQAVSTEIPNQLGEVKTYRDDLARFALDYPAEWYIENDALQGAEESVAYSVRLFSWDPTAATPPSKDLNTLPDGATKIDITVFNEGSETLAEAVHQLKTQDSGASVNFLKEENWVLNDGQQAVYLEAEGAFGVVGTMLTLVNGKTVYISGYGDLILFKAIAMTLRAE